MADKKISQLPAATAPTGTEEVPVVQDGVTKKATVSQILAGTPADAVTSVDGRTGAVTLADKYVDVTGDTMTGDLRLNANLGAGVAPSPDYRAYLNQTATNTAGVGPIGLYVQQNWSATVDSTAYITGGTARIYATLSAGATLTNGASEGITAWQGITQVSGDGTYAAQANGLLGYVVKTGTGTLNSAKAFLARSPNVTGGTVTNAIGLEVLAQKVTGVTTGYGIYQRGANDINVFAGPLALGTTPATTGAIRLPNNQAVMARNAANSADVNVVTVGAANGVNVGSAGATSVGLGAPTIPVYVYGNVGFYGTTPIAKPTGTPAAAVDAATTMALVNDLRAKLIALGLIS